MKKIINLLLLLPLLWLAGCSEDDGLGHRSGAEPGSEVSFNVGFAPEAALSAPMTRATTDAEFNTVFEDGDEIGIFAHKAGTTDVVAQNVKLIRQDGKWVAATDHDKIYYPLDGSNLDFYAYYPYQGDHNTTKDNLSFVVQADQSTPASYSKSDLLTATAISQSSSLVKLSFNHLMAMVQVTADRVAPVPTFREGTDGFKVVLKNIKQETATLNWATNTAAVNPSASAIDIVMYRVPTTDGSWVFRALLPSQVRASGALFRFNQALQGNVIDMNYTTISQVTLLNAKASTYRVTLDYGLVTDHIYTVGDIYPYRGTSVGIVYETSNGGKNGKIVSLDEVMDSWGREDIATGATNGSDGLLNMATVYTANNSSFVNYPIFLWADAKNPAGTIYNSGAKYIWYIPSFIEMMNLHSVRPVINPILNSAGGVTIAIPPYLSSTERNLTQAYKQGGIPVSKSEISSARAIMAF